MKLVIFSHSGAIIRPTTESGIPSFHSNDLMASFTPASVLFFGHAVCVLEFCPSVMHSLEQETA